jgi:hypothetical protein
MPKINVYLPEDLAAAVKNAGVPVSSVCQHALADAVAASGMPAASAQFTRSGPNPARLTDRARTAIDTARGAAGAHDPTTVDLLDGLAAEGANLGVAVLAALDIEMTDLVEEVHALARAGKPTAAPLDEATARAVGEALRLGHDYVGCEHLLLGLASGPDDELVAATLARMGADVTTLRQGVRTALAGWTHARETLTFSGLSTPIRAALDDIRQRLARLEG